MSASSSSSGLDRSLEARKFYRLLGTRPKNDKVFNRAIEIFGISSEKSLLLEDDAYRVIYRERIRLALLLEEAFRLCPVGVEMLETQGRLEFLRHIVVRPTRDSYRFEIDDDYMGWDTLHVRLELRNNSLFRKALLEHYYQRLSPSVQRLRQALAAMRISFFELMARPGSMRTQLFLNQEPDFLGAAFEIVGSPPLGFNGDLYDLPSLVEHYCTLFGHTQEQEEYLLRQGKTVYLNDLKLQAAVRMNLKAYRPIFIDMNTLRIQYRSWTSYRRHHQPPAEPEWPLAAHYIQQAFLLDEDASYQGWDMLLEFVFEPFLTFTEERLARSKEVLDKVLQGLSYDSSFLEQFDHLFRKWCQSRLEEPNIYFRLMRLVSFPSEDIVRPNRIDSLRIWLRWNPMLTNYRNGDDLRLELLRAAVYNHYEMFMLLLDHCDVHTLKAIMDPGFLSRHSDVRPSGVYKKLIEAKINSH